MDVVHGTYNAGSDTLKFRQFSRPRFEGPRIDVHKDEPWQPPGADGVRWPA
jgi:hypothetical protein